MEQERGIALHLATSHSRRSVAYMAPKVLSRATSNGGLLKTLLSRVVLGMLGIYQDEGGFKLCPIRTTGVFLRSSPQQALPCCMLICFPPGSVIEAGAYRGRRPVRDLAEHFEVHPPHNLLVLHLQGPRTQITGFQGPSTIILMVFGP